MERSEALQVVESHEWKELLKRLDEKARELLDSRNIDPASEVSIEAQVLANNLAFEILDEWVREVFATAFSEFDLPEKEKSVFVYSSNNKGREEDKQ